MDCVQFLMLAGVALALPARAVAQGADAPAPADSAGFQLPAPTGPFRVGTTSWTVVDPSRPESFSASGAPRQIKVVAWYPTSTDKPQRYTVAPYLRESIAEAQTFATVVRSPGIFDHLAAVRTHSLVDAPPAAASTKRPILVFSHGYTGLVSAYTGLLEDLASHGYVVLSVAHPYEVVAVTLADGSVATMLDSAGAIRQGIRDVLREWSTEDSTMAVVTGTAGEDAQRQILRDFMSRGPNTVAVVERWVADERLALSDFLERRSGVAGQLARVADTTRIGVFGHSMGGVVAGEFCVTDARCRAGLNLDGIPQWGSMLDASMRQPFLMVYSARPGRLGASDAIYARAAHPYYRVDVSDTRHLDFSDMNFWGGPLSRASGPMAAPRAAALTRRIVREYFEQELRAIPSPLLAGKDTLPGVTVHAPAQAP